MCASAKNVKGPVAKVGTCHKSRDLRGGPVLLTLPRHSWPLPDEHTTLLTCVFFLVLEFKPKAFTLSFSF